MVEDMILAAKTLKALRACAKESEMRTMCVL